MKKCFFVVLAALCLGLCSCVVNVDGNSSNGSSMGTVKVYFELADRYEPGWISVEEIRIVNDNSGLKYVWDERMWDGNGHSFTVKPGYYYVEIDAYSRWTREEYTRITRRPTTKYVNAGQTVKVTFDGDDVFFQ